MAVLRQHPQVRLPDDFGLGLAVSALLGALLLLALAASSGGSSLGPRAESRAPSGNEAYVDIQPSTAPGILPTR